MDHVINFSNPYPVDRAVQRLKNGGQIDRSIFTFCGLLPRMIWMLEVHSYTLRHVLLESRGVTQIRLTFG